MRRVLAPALPVLVALLAIAPAASAAPPAARVVGGATATPTDVPWQALVLPSGYLCGGSILDATHIVTAAHCVYDDQARTVVAPTAITVKAGIIDRLNDAGQQPAVTTVSVDPAYDPGLQTSDVAVLTLGDGGLTFNPGVQSIALTDVGYRPVIGVTDLWLSGWGSDVARSPQDTTTPHPVQNLQVAKSLHASDQCAGVYAPFDDAMLLCAGQANLDACQGDSGGPLAVSDNGVWKLAGVVNGGAGCGWPGYPGYYARVANPDINAFLARRGAGYALRDPVITGAPTIAGSAEARSAPVTVTTGASPTTLKKTTR